MMGPREVMGEKTESVTINLALWEPISPSVIPPKSVVKLVEDLVKSKNPLIVTSYLGRNPEAVEDLVQLSKRLAIPVIESVSNEANFPTDNLMYWGHQWATAGQNGLLADADIILVLDSDIPWITMENKPSDGAIVYYIYIDPLKEEVPLWYIPSKIFFKADTQVTLEQINKYLDGTSPVNEEMVAKCWGKNSGIHAQQSEKSHQLEKTAVDVVTPEYLTACVREIIYEDTIVLNEGI